MDDSVSQHSNRGHDAAERQDQTSATNIEHVAVPDDPRKWSDDRKVTINWLSQSLITKQNTSTTAIHVGLSVLRKSASYVGC